MSTNLPKVRRNIEENVVVWPTIPESVKKRGLRGSTQASVDTLNRLIGELPSKYKSLRDKQVASTKLGLTGLGEWVMGDNPDTPEVEENAVYRSNKRIGDREARAVQEQDAQANARGLQFSSFRDKGVGDALGRLSREAQAVVTQYADAMNTIAGDEKTEGINLAGQLSQLYGDEADYLRDNPELANSTPGTPAAPAAPAEPAAPAVGNPGTGTAKPGERLVWTGQRPPNMAHLKSLPQYKNGTLRVVLISPKGAPPQYRVFFS